MAPVLTPKSVPGQGRGHHSDHSNQRASCLCHTHTHRQSNRLSQASFWVSSTISTHTHRKKVEAFGFKCSLQHLQSRNGSQREKLRKTPSQRQEAWQVSVQSWLSSTWRKDLGWKREWAFSSLGSHVDTPTPCPRLPSSQSCPRRHDRVPFPKFSSGPRSEATSKEPERFR